MGVPASFLTCQVGGETQAEEAVVVTTQAGGEATDHEEQTRGREGASLPPDRAGLFSCEVGGEVGLCVPMPGLSAFSSAQFSRSVVSDSLQPHESLLARPPCPSPTPGVHSDSCPSSP